MSDIFDNDPKDRKRRFLRGLNHILGSGYYHLEDKNIPMKEAIRINLPELRGRLASIYCLEFTKEELAELMLSGITTGEFTEKYVKVIYKDRGNVKSTCELNISQKD